PASAAAPRPPAEASAGHARSLLPFPRSPDEAEQPRPAGTSRSLRASFDGTGTASQRTTHRHSSRSGSLRRSSSRAALASTHLHGTFPSDAFRVNAADDVLDLDVSHNSISDLNGSRLLAWLPQLRTVCLAGNLLTSVTSVLPLAALPHLQSLDVRDNPCQPPGGRPVLLALLLVPLLAHARRAARLRPPQLGPGRGAGAPPRPRAAGGEPAPAGTGRDPVLAEVVACARARLTRLRELGARARSGAREEWRPSHVAELLAKGRAYLPAASAHTTPIAARACGSGVAAGASGHFPSLVALDGEDIFVHTLESAAEAASQLLLDGAAPVARAAGKRSRAVGGFDLHRRSQEHIKEFHARFRREVREFHRRLEERDREKRKVARSLSTSGLEGLEDPIEFGLDDVTLHPRRIIAPASPVAASAERLLEAADAGDTPDVGPLEDDERAFKAMETQLWSDLRHEELRLEAPTVALPKNAESPGAPRNEAWEEQVAASRRAAATSAKLPEWLGNFVRVPVPFNVRGVQERNRAMEVACGTASTEALAGAVAAAFADPRGQKDPRGHGRAPTTTPSPEAGPDRGAALKRQQSQRLAKKLGLGDDTSHEPEVLQTLRASGTPGADRRSSVALQQRLQQLAEDYPEEFMTATGDEHPTLLQSSLWVLGLHESPTRPDGWRLRSVRLTEGGQLWVGPELGQEGPAKLHLGGRSVMSLQVQRCRPGVEAVSSLHGLPVFPFRIDLLGGRAKRAKHFAAASAQMCDDWMRACRGLLHSEVELPGSTPAE
ncbi:unnamed protein product, partial [Prorocentrum cordatum]